MDLVVKDPNLAVGLEQAKIVNDPELLQLLKMVSIYKSQTDKVNIENSDERNKANDSFIAVRDTKNKLEEIRVRAVAFPNLFIKTINNMFKEWKNTLLSVESKYTRAMEKYDEEMEREALKKVKVQEAIPEVQDVADLPFEENQSVVEPPPVPEGLEKTRETELGSVQAAKVTEIDVDNPLLLAKAAINQTNKNIPLSVISIDMSELKKAVKESRYSIKQWKKYGVVITEKRNYRAKVK